LLQPLQLLGTPAVLEYSQKNQALGFKPYTENESGKKDTHWNREYMSGVLPKQFRAEPFRGYINFGSVT
jgi:hypothetical protein